MPARLTSLLAWAPCGTGASEIGEGGGKEGSSLRHQQGAHLFVFLLGLESRDVETSAF